MPKGELSEIRIGADWRNHAKIEARRFSVLSLRRVLIKKDQYPKALPEAWPSGAENQAREIQCNTTLIQIDSKQRCAIP
jgi:hypothetical protein